MKQILLTIMLLVSTSSLFALFDGEQDEGSIGIIAINNSVSTPNITPPTIPPEASDDFEMLAACSTKCSSITATSVTGTTWGSTVSASIQAEFRLLDTVATAKTVYANGNRTLQYYEWDKEYAEPRYCEKPHTLKIESVTFNVYAQQLDGSKLLVQRKTEIVNISESMSIAEPIKVVTFSTSVSGIPEGNPATRSFIITCDFEWSADSHSEAEATYSVVSKRRKRHKHTKGESKGTESLTVQFKCQEQTSSSISPDKNAVRVSKIKVQAR